MEAKAMNLGNSLFVPCVQELAKESLATILPRYIRSDQQQPVVSDTGLVLEIPLTNMQSLLSDGSMEAETEEALELYSLKLKNLAMAIFKKMEKALDMETREMEEFFGKNKVIGLTPHSDSTVLIIRLQVNEVEGIQIKRDDTWVPVKPLPIAFIINVGDIIEHRAIVNSEIERLSIATFNNAKYDGEIGPARSLISKEKPPLFKRVSTEEYFKGMFASKLNEKSYLDTLRL
ncbi:hypothetical protein SLEP1_g16410 [Rubroshorea leprosula]|uniref:Fe2OG dioxygenase domain-containing protein n=1 Tax=Rubroshorea leprosula TaxID=152421 RepID=A0AAV5IYD6_9ROSI|nr:hypothetical protein SLEP1_g16410 [Rubroshorea leprosula]